MSPDFDVAVIGCGPVGALAANLLGRAGLGVLVVEQEAEPHPLPRAVHLDHEMMRLFQAAGVIDAVSPTMRDTDGHLHVGADMGVIRYLGTAGSARPFGWANDYFFYQPELEATLRQALGAYSNVDLRLGTAFVGLGQRDGRVTLALESDGRRSMATARWVIACDGARSAVRKNLGIALDDLDFEEPWLVVDAKVDGPICFPVLSGVPANADLQRLSVMMCDPRRPATIVPGRGNHRRWEFMLLPGEDDGEMSSPERVAELVAPWVADVPHRIIRAATYRFHGLVAKQWCHGNVFLAGDAAHQTPPFFGQGMCHGFRDVANLAWKLDLIRRGIASEDLLDTYQPERDPHVRAVISAAVEAGRYICMLDPAEAQARDAAMRAPKPAGARTAGDLIPAIDPSGVVAAGTPGAGERFIQPMIRDAKGTRLLDDIAGSGWRVFADGADAASDVRRSLPEQLDVSVIDASTLADDGAICGWLAQRGVSAVLVRPDHYVFGTSTGAFAPLAEALAFQLRRPAVRAAERVA